MSAIPPEVERLLRERDQARAARDFALADEIRDQISALGYDIRDSASGATAVAKPSFTALDPTKVPDTLDEPASHRISIHVLHEGFPDDVERFVQGFARHCSEHDYEIVVCEAASADAERIDALAATDRVRVLHLASDPGWGAAQNASLRTATGEIVALADLSVEPSGDLLGPVLNAFDDPSTGVAGPWGLKTSDMREFEDAQPGEAHAIEGYFLAARREILRKEMLDEKFRWYRIADIEYSFRVRSLGYKAVVTGGSAERHTHRGWAALDDDERAKRSKKAFNRFLDRFRNRKDLLNLGPEGR